MTSSTSLARTLLASTAPDDLLKLSYPVLLVLGITILSLVAWKFTPGTIRKANLDLHGPPIYHTWLFFKKRYDFIWGNFRRNGRKMFRFRVLHHSVVALTGEEARKIFFSDQSMRLGEGYRLLVGGAPRMEDIDVDSIGGDTEDADFIRRVHLLLQKDRISDMIPVLCDDIHRRLEEWGTKGSVQPFREVYDVSGQKLMSFVVNLSQLAFQTTVRVATCRELAEDTATIGKLAQAFWDFETSTSVVSLLFPWLPSFARRKRHTATITIYGIISQFVGLRRGSQSPSSDAIDILISEGVSDEIIFVLTTVLAGVSNTGMNICWNLIYLGIYGEWKAKVIAEVRQLLANHTDASSTEPLHKRLSIIPLEAWEDEMPALDGVIRETLRMTMSSTAMRRNMQRDIQLSSGTLRRGDFLAYSMADVHEDPELYPNPEVFDPERYERGREEDKRAAFGHLGFGAGRHLCPGMRVAKVEMKIIIALFLLGYEYGVFDKQGCILERPPGVDKNNYLQARMFLIFQRLVAQVNQARPTEQSYYIRYHKVNV
ncbi:hypothetical protein DXG01_013036 [Tephrocybe rancida]|nr:hypothetical protein DXG01_013036 [Tephrocybe rancida]